MVPDRTRIIPAIWLALARLGIAPADVLARAGLPADTVPETELTTAQAFAVWRALEELTGDPGIAVRIVEEVGSDSTAHPLAIVAALHARTYREGLGVLIRYKQVSSTERVHLADAYAWTDWIHASEPPPSPAIDQGLALLLLLGRKGSGHRIVPERLELRRASSTPAHEAYFDCPIVHGAATDRLVFAPGDLDRLFTAHNPGLLAVLEPVLSSSLAELHAQRSFREQVKLALKRDLGDGRPSLETVAAHMRLSERTLQRRITDEGTTFRDLLAEARRDLGRELLAAGQAKIDEVAFLLGYQDTSSFQRAFRSWEGVSPSEWRDLQRDLAPSAAQGAQRRS